MRGWRLRALIDSLGDGASLRPGWTDDRLTPRRLCVCAGTRPSAGVHVQAEKRLEVRVGAQAVQSVLCEPGGRAVLATATIDSGEHRPVPRIWSVADDGDDGALLGALDDAIEIVGGPAAAACRAAPLTCADRRNGPGGWCWTSTASRATGVSVAVGARLDG